MNSTPMTSADRLNVVLGGAAYAVALFAIATLVHRAISNKDHSKRIQGEPIRWWIALLSFGGSSLGAYLANNAALAHELVGGLAGFGLISGVVIGNIHGAILLARSQHPTEAIELNELSTSIEDESDNPYVAPKMRS